MTDKRFAMQNRILAYLATVPAPIASPSDYGTHKTSHLPTTGAVIDALGMSRNNASFAAVSRSLDRLHKAGKILAWQGAVFYGPGKGLRYSLPVQQ